MPVREILSAAAEFYLVFTLVATSLAKLRRWRGSSLALVRERVIPAGLAPVVIIGAAVGELALATLMTLGFEAFKVGCVTAATFALFGAYRLTVAAKTKSLECPCAGTTEYSPATPQAIAALIVTCLFQIGMAALWALNASQGRAGEAILAGATAWILPFGVLLIGGIAWPRVHDRGQPRPHDTVTRPADVYPVR